MLLVLYIHFISLFPRRSRFKEVWAPTRALTSPKSTRRERLANTAKSNMANFTTKSRQLQEIAHNSPWEDFLSSCAVAKEKMNFINIAVPKLGEVKVDFHADELEEFVPVVIRLAMALVAFEHFGS